VVVRFDIWWTDLDPVRGSEYAKTRPCVVVSPAELNESLKTVVVMPMTTVSRSWPFRLPVLLEGQVGQVCVDQIRVIDKSRLKSKAGSLDEGQAARLRHLIKEMYVD
jgi:mRNA interferase MazF